MSSILASYTVDHLLSGVQSHADLEIAHVVYTISRLRTCVTQFRDSENAQWHRVLILSRHFMPPHVICVGGACIAHAQCSMARMMVEPGTY